MSRPNAISAGSDNITQWSDSEKARCSRAGIAALLATPANTRTSIGTKDICFLLDRGPSYIQFCQSLEDKGFVIGRRAFARALLPSRPRKGINEANKPDHRETPRKMIQALVKGRKGEMVRHMEPATQSHVLHCRQQRQLDQHTLHIRQLYGLSTRETQLGVHIMIQRPLQAKFSWQPDSTRGSLA